MERFATVGRFALAGVIGGLVGAGVCLAFFRPAEPRARPVASAEKVTAADPALETRLAALEAAVRALETRRPVQPRTEAATTSAAARTTSAPSTGDLIDDPLFEAAVRDVLSRIETDRRAERDVRRDERWRARVENYVNRLEAQLGLNAEQKAQMAAIALEHRDTLRQRLDAIEDTDPNAREKRRELTAALRAEAERKLEQVLDARQMAQYRQLGEDMRIGGRGAPRGDSGGRRGSD